jgi:DNA modification methylase
MNIEYVPVSALKPYAANARTHGARQIRKIANSIKAFGFNNPILAADDYTVIAGHGRLEAAKQLKMATVPVVRLSHMSKEQIRAYVLADNKLALDAGWDRDMLAIELQGLVDLNFDVELTGFETAEIDIVLGEANEAAESNEVPEDDIPDNNGPIVSRLGDIWILGKHRLLCGDARMSESYSALLSGEMAEFVFTDPPYNVRIGGNVSGLGKVRHGEFAMASGEMTPAQFTEFLTVIFRRLAGNSIDGSIHQICMDWRHMRETLDAGRESYSELKNLCVWNKTNAGMGSFYRSQHELVFAFKSGTAPHVNNIELGRHGRSRSNVWTYAGVNTFRAGRMDELGIHPTAKPVALVSDAIKDCSSHGGIVLDPFCGSGTMLIAAERTGRKARAIELAPNYVDAAVCRWQRFTGKKAVLLETGDAFEQVEEARCTPVNDNNATQAGAA